MHMPYLLYHDHYNDRPIGTCTVYYAVDYIHVYTVIHAYLVNSLFFHSQLPIQEEEQAQDQEEQTQGELCVVHLCELLLELCLLMCVPIGNTSLLLADRGKHAV